MINICDHLFLAEQTRTEADNENMIKFINIIMMGEVYDHCGGDYQHLMCFQGEQTRTEADNGPPCFRRPEYTKHQLFIINTDITFVALHEFNIVK